MPLDRGQRYYDRVPSTFTAWRRAERFFGTVSHANQVREFNSPSDVKKDKYLSLRVLTVWERPTKTQRSGSQDSHYMQITSSQSVSTYQSQPTSNDLANITSSRLRQIQVVRNLEEENGDDEETVNLSIIKHLTTITAPHPRHNRAEWIGSRLELKAMFHSAYLTAIIDRYLRVRGGRRTEVKALIEAKARRRLEYEPWEGTQFVAFLKDKKPPAGELVFLISQDGSELYVSAAIPSAAYLAYIKNQSSRLDPADFLRIRRYGPYDIRIYQKMDIFSCKTMAPGLNVFVSLILTVQLPHVGAHPLVPENSQGPRRGRSSQSSINTLEVRLNVQGDQAEAGLAMVENLERALRKTQAEIGLDDSRNAAIHNAIRAENFAELIIPAVHSSPPPPPTNTEPSSTIYFR
ncbi:hypothetical protein N7445_009260 [Penicillium cf. griseofulvum]|nr:hypothetical protein N7445_009260 [Penicillium cf. griseofulvum]